MEIRIWEKRWGGMKLICNCYNCMEDLRNKQIYDIENLPQWDMGELSLPFPNNYLDSQQ